MPGAAAERRTFRPRSGRLVPLVLGGVLLAMMVGVAAFLPSIVGHPTGAGDRVGMVVFGIGGAWVLYRFASVRADAGAEGLAVRNVMHTRTLEWAEVVSVRFGPDRPWVQLDLADGDTLAVMAVQRADGAYAQAQARGLATLVARYSATSRDD